MNSSELTSESVEVADDSDASPDELDHQIAEAQTDDALDVDEPEIIEVELTDEDYGGGLFTGVEDADAEETSESASRAPGSRADEALGLTDDHSHIETAINEGAARLAVVGLDSEHKLENDEDAAESDCLEAEFRDVFHTFRLGHFGAGFLDEYIFTENDDIDPAWGLLGAMLCAAAFTVWMRPDSDVIIQDAKDALVGGAA